MVFAGVILPRFCPSKMGFDRNMGPVFIILPMGFIQTVWADAFHLWFSNRYGFKFGMVEFWYYTKAG